mgnify:CR=1 FL=1
MLEDGAENNVHLEISGHVQLDFIEKLTELPGTVARHAFADDRSRLHVEGGEQCRGAVAFVVVGTTFDLAGGCVRSSAWIWVFSSTQSTRARSGGSR